MLTALLALACLIGPNGAPLLPSARCDRPPAAVAPSVLNVLNARLRPDPTRAYAGTPSHHAVYAGGRANAYARTVRSVSWRTGEEVWYGAAFFLPTGFAASLQGEVALLRWDNWPTYHRAGDVGGLVVWGRDHRAHVKAGTYGSEQPLIGPVDLPEGRWIWVQIHQRFSDRDGQALTELWVDGRLLGRSTAANTSGREIERLRTGLVAIEAGTQTQPLSLWFARPTVAAQRVPPAGG